MKQIEQHEEQSAIEGQLNDAQNCGTANKRPDKESAAREVERSSKVT